MAILHVRSVHTGIRDSKRTNGFNKPGRTQVVAIPKAQQIICIFGEKPGKQFEGK